MKHHTYDHLNNPAADMRYRLAASYLTTNSIRNIIEIGGANPAKTHEPKILPYLRMGHFASITIIDPKAPDDEFHQDVSCEERVVQIGDTFQNVMTNRFAELMAGKLHIHVNNAWDVWRNERKTGIGLCIMGCSLHLDNPTEDYRHIFYLMEESNRIVLEYRLTNPLGVQQVADLTEWLDGFGLHEKLMEFQFNPVHGKGYVNTSEVFNDPRRFIVYQRRD